MTDNRVPFEEAIQHLAETMNMPESEARRYAEQFRANRLYVGTPMTHAGVGSALRGALQMAIAAERAVAGSAIKGGDLGGPYALEWNDPAANLLDDLQRMQKALGNVDLAARRLDDLRNPRPWISLRQPTNPHDRRTFRIAGKPYHFAQGKGSLRLQPGETQWV